MLRFSLVFMLQERGPRQKTRLMTDIITLGVGNSTILNQDGKMKILSYVACFYSKCLAKMKSERPVWQCFLTKSCSNGSNIDALCFGDLGTKEMLKIVAWNSWRVSNFVQQHSTGVANGPNMWGCVQMDTTLFKTSLPCLKCSCLCYALSQKC